MYDHGMLLSDIEIRAAARSGLITPWHEHLLQPASVDVRLDHMLINPDTDASYEISDGFELEPGAFMLGCTIETVTLPLSLAARFEGKSSLARRGLASHITAGFIDPGFTGQITVELSNVSHRMIILTPGMRIGQVCFMRMSMEPSNGYGDVRFGSHYQGQRGPTLAHS